MRRRLLQLPAAAVAVVVLLSVVASAWATLALRLSPTHLLVLPAVAAFAVSGWVLVVRVPRNVVGWLVLVAALGFASLPWTLISSWLHLTVGRVTASWANSSWVLAVGGLALLLPLFFPDGRLPSSRRRWRVFLGIDVVYVLMASLNIMLNTTNDLPGYGPVRNTSGS
jgi:hypothetical protein